jgi:hypothetical protein
VTSPDGGTLMSVHRLDAGELRERAVGG